MPLSNEETNQNIPAAHKSKRGWHPLAIRVAQVTVTLTLWPGQAARLDEIEDLDWFCSEAVMDELERRTIEKVNSLLESGEPEEALP